MSPRVSVVMPVKDGERHLRGAVDSVLAQDFRDFELLVVDDGSTDSTPALLAAVRDPRLVVLRNEENAGPSASRNRALAAARGEIVAFLDADDEALPGRFARQVAFLDAHPTIGLVAGAVETIDSEGRPSGVTLNIPVGVAPTAWQLLLFDNPIVPSTVAARRGLIVDAGGFDESLRLSEDRELWSRLFSRTTIATLPERLARYRIHDDSAGARGRDAMRAQSVATRSRLCGEFLGDAAAAASIAHWYDAPIAGDDVRALTTLFLRVFARLASDPRHLPDEIDAVRRDLEERLDSLRRRDGRIAGKSAARHAVSSLVPEGVKRLLRGE